MFSISLKILPVVTKQAVAEMRIYGGTQTSTRYEIVRTAAPYQSVRETVLTSCGIPFRITCNQITPSTYPFYGAFVVGGSSHTVALFFVVIIRSDPLYSQQWAKPVRIICLGLFYTVLT